MRLLPKRARQLKEPWMLLPIRLPERVRQLEEPWAMSPLMPLSAMRKTAMRHLMLVEPYL
jgi:hypothetical protein